MVREFPCRGCQKPILLKGAWCYKSKEQIWKRTEKEDVMGLDPEHINTDSRTDVTFWCDECHEKFGKKDG
ncbi:MAG: hypothetical protein ACYS8W_02960 [Planctomycetota bacterium]|jgi:hypothetical protein